MRRSRLKLLIVMAVAAVAASAALPLARAWWWWREANPVRRGAEVAARAGCFACHGPGGTGGLPDPALGDDVPSWDGGVPMMYVNGAAEVREFVLDGVSRRRARSASATERRGRAAVRMPAYRGTLTAREIDDVVAFFLAAARMENHDDPRVAQGRDLVEKLRCERCHGVAGAGGVRNPGSLKGYVPGWLGGDFADLVRDDGELRAWILDGGIDRLEGNHLARYFLSRQKLQMPAYRPALSSSEADAVIAYVRARREGR